MAEKIEITHEFSQRFWPELIAGRLRPIADRTIPIGEAEAAHRYVAENRNMGSVWWAPKTVPRKTATTVHNAFLSIDSTRDLALFDIKVMRGDFRQSYYRLRKGKYRATFYVDDDIFIVYVGKREELYRLWE